MTSDRDTTIERQRDRVEVVVVGVGGLGCPAALGLAASGVGAITLVDPDRVESSNLPRQLLHRERDIGKMKVESAAATLAERFPSQVVRTVADALTATNAGQILAEADFVIDATDGIETKLLINDTAVKSRRPFCYSGVIGLGGQVMLVDPGKTPCLRCIFPGISSDDAEDFASCGQAGIVGPVAGIFGALQASLAVAFLSGDHSVAGQLIRYDRLSDRWNNLTVGSSTHCQTCALGSPQAVDLEGDSQQWPM